MQRNCIQVSSTPDMALPFHPPSCTHRPPPQPSAPFSVAQRKHKPVTLRVGTSIQQSLASKHFRHIAVRTATAVVVASEILFSFYPAIPFSTIGLVLAIANYPTLTSAGETGKCSIVHAGVQVIFWLLVILLILCTTFHLSAAHLRSNLSCPSTTPPPSLSFRNIL